MSETVRLGLLGGTGIEGRGLALRFAKAGLAVTIGSRSLERAREAAGGLNKELGHQSIAAAENRRMIASSEVVLLTIPFQHAASAVETYRDCFRQESVLVDVTVPVVFDRGRARLLELPEGSGSQHLAKRLPEGIPLVAAFKTIPAELLADLASRLDCDVFVCGDSKEARARVTQWVRHIPGLRPVDAGALETAATLERMCLLAIGINRRYKIKSARFRVVGL